MKENHGWGVRPVASHRWDIQPCMGQAKTTDGTTHQWFPECSVVPTDIQRLLFVTLKATLADTNLDAFEAIAASMYLEGNLEKDIDGDFPYQEMTLELRLNVCAFYKWCCRYPFTALSLTKWATLVVQEYHFLDNHKSLAEMGMSDFDCLPSFSVDQRAWSANFNLRPLRLTNTDILGPKPPLWADICVLRLLFSKQ
jgi:hypothetical protein